MSKHWSNEENDYLINNYKKITIEEIINKLHRKKQAIVKHYSDLINFKHVSLKVIDVICPRCNCKIGEVKSKVYCGNRKSRTLCSSCRLRWKLEQSKRLREDSKFVENASRRMKLNNPMFNKEIVDKVFESRGCVRHEKRIKDKNWKENLVSRMKLNNPMFDEKTKEKMSKTFSDKIKTGEIEYKHGADHHLWKGNRDFNNTCRIQLYPKWTKVILERDGFSCSVCKSKKYLQVHHIRPLREIIDIIKKKYNISTFATIDSTLWQPYIDEILTEHKLDDGISVCRTCHSKIDNYYRIRYEDQKNMENTL